MPPKTPTQKYHEVFEACEPQLIKHGFSRRSTTYRIVEDGNCGIIEFQRSRKDSTQKLCFTVNIGVVYGRLLNHPESLTKSRIIDAHLRQRIGHLMPCRRDMWWDISQQTESEELAKEVCRTLTEFAVPYILQYLSVDAIRTLWASGQSPGLTELQRKEYLSMIGGPG